MERCRRGEACKESGAGEVSSNSLVRVRVKVKVRERMGGGLVKLVFILGFFLKIFNIIYTGQVRAGYAYTRTRPEPASGFF